MKPSDSAMLRTSVGLLLMLTLMLAACGRSGDDGAGATGRGPQSAAEVHATFLVALRTHDRAQVLALTVDEEQASRADEFLQRIRAYQDRTITRGPYATGGTLQDVRVIRVEATDDAAHAWSRWQYRKKSVCHETELTHTPAGWRVLEFYVAGSDAQCAP